MSPVKPTDYYKALGITPQATPREIKKSYMGWIRYFDHPEEAPKPGSLQGSLTEQIEQVQKAYDLLADESRRAEYNARMNFHPEPPEPAAEAEETQTPHRAYGDVEGIVEKRRQARCYLEFFGLSEKPFELTPDPRYFYLSSRHKELLAQLVLALQENKGIVKVIGEVGTGKTTLCRSFLKELDSGYEFAYLFHPCADAVELMQYINAEFGLPSQSQNKNELLSHLMRFIAEKKNEGRGVAVIVDEAQSHSPEALAELCILSNMETEKEKLLQAVLIGQPQINKILNRPALNQLRHRITAQWELQAFNVEETHGYIQHRLNMSGGKGKVAFSRAAADAVFRYAGGRPRMINRIADQTLAVAHQEGVKKIDRDHVREAEKELENIQPKPSGGGALGKLAIAVGVIALLIALYVYFQSQFPWNAPPPKEESLSNIIQSKPMDLSQPGKLVPQTAPQTRTLGAVTKPAEEPAIRTGEIPAGEPSKKSEKNLNLSQKDALVGELLTLSAGESRIEAARSVLQRWGAFRKQTVTLNPKARHILKTNYGISVYESNGSLDRLTTLNYPALVEVRLPEGRGSRYLALIGLKGNVGIFQSDKILEIPLSLFDSMWTHKSIVLWKDYEALPGDMKIGYKGKPAQWLQQQLGHLGYFNHPPTPSYGERTSDAVAKFQRYHNLKDHGRLDTETKMILYNRLPAYHSPRLTGS